MLLLSPLPRWYEFLFDQKPPVLNVDVDIQQLKQGRFGEFDLVIITDTNSNTQLPEFEKFLKVNNKPVLVIDHHRTGDHLGTVQLLDSSAAATGLIIYDFLKFANWPLNDKVAQQLFVAVASDTGWFQFANTDSRVFQRCAELIKLGANPVENYHELFQNFSLPRLKLTAAMLNTLELHFNGRLATQFLLQTDFVKTGATQEDTENLINECKRIITVEVAALFVELKDGRIKCSLRSSGDVDVCKIAEKLGGGGHKMAAGAHLKGPLHKVTNLIKDEVEKQLL